MNKWQRWKGIMKAVPFEEKRLAKWQPPYIVQPKFDGIRCRAIPTQTERGGPGYMLLSSEENVIFSCPHINEVLSGFQLDCELDGELYNHQIYLEGGFDLVSSITSRTVNLHSRHREMQFHIFDIVNDQPQMRRQLTVEALRGLSPWLPIAPFWLCENLDEVMKVYEQLIDQGYEGVIIRHLANQYEKKRSTFVMKFKPKQEDIYEIVGATEEIDKDGSPKGALGALICKGADGATFKVGSGFTRDDRVAYWKGMEVLKGKSVRVKYQHSTAGRGVPRFGIFCEIIEDPLKRTPPF